MKVRHKISLQYMYRLKGAFRVYAVVDGAELFLREDSKTHSYTHVLRRCVVRVAARAVRQWCPACQCVGGRRAAGSWRTVDVHDSAPVVEQRASMPSCTSACA